MRIYKLSEATNWPADKAKGKLIKKYNTIYKDTLAKGDCIQHHLDGNHLHNTQLKNNILMIANTKAEAVRAHKLIHLLAYAKIESELQAELNSLNVKYFYCPDFTDNDKKDTVYEPEYLDTEVIINKLVPHIKNLITIEQDLSTKKEDEKSDN